MLPISGFVTSDVVASGEYLVTTSYKEELDSVLEKCALLNG
jgi:hypothetical protein